MEPAGPEGAVGFDPVVHDALHDDFQLLAQLRKSIPQQEAEIDALGAVVQLPLVNGQARCFCERLW
jgi:hypothetical protein